MINIKTETNGVIRHGYCPTGALGPEYKDGKKKIVVLAMVVEVLSVKLTWDDNLHQFRREPEETSLRMRACWKERGKGASGKSGSRNLP